MEFQSIKSGVQVRPSSAYKKKNDLGPGEQFNRGYHMPIDKQSFRFGEVKKPKEGGVGDCLFQSNDGNAITQSRYGQEMQPKLSANVIVESNRLVNEKLFYQSKHSPSH